MVLHQPFLLLTDVGLEFPYAVGAVILECDAKVSH
jgi:hypothetical protein